MTGLFFRLRRGGLVDAAVKIRGVLKKAAPVSGGEIDRLATGRTGEDVVLDGVPEELKARLATARARNFKSDEPERFGVLQLSTRLHSLRSASRDGTMPSQAPAMQGFPLAARPRQFREVC